jgi:hypothetical protein
MAKNKEELLKLRYDFEKTVLFAVLGILLTSSFAIRGTTGLFSSALSFLIIVCIIVGVIFLFRLKKTVYELRDFYK